MSDRTIPMPRNTDGEFELVLGNKQLLSAFFLSIIVLGVFFTLGYIVGRNSTLAQTATKTAGADAEGATAQPASLEQSNQPALITQPYSPPAVAESGAAATRDAPQAVSSEVENASELKVSTTGGGLPRLGETFLQVSAVARPEAEVLADILQRKGFRSMVAPGPSESLHRVLVGPVREVAEIAKMKASLERAGFKSIVRKY
jgi:cell division septation protein DedD